MSVRRQQPPSRKGKLFINPILDDFRNDPRIVQNLNGVRLLNLPEFLDWFMPVTRESERITDYASRNPDAEKKLEFYRGKGERERKKIADDILKGLAFFLCGASIGKGYGMAAVEKALQNDDFDLLVAISPDKINLSRKTIPVLNNKFNNVLGFIIPEFGECTMKPDVWSVNLICVKPNEYNFKSLMLLGAFLYCIRNNDDYTKEGVLELAGGYKNINGFISYTKMGFNKDLSLYQETAPICFTDYNNLPMSIHNIHLISNDRMINRVVGRERRIVKPTEDDSGLYNAGQIDPKLQTKIIVCNDLLYRLELNYNNIIRNPYGTLEIDVNPKRMIALLTRMLHKIQVPLTKEVMINALKKEREMLFQQLQSQQQQQSASSPPPSPSPPSSPYSSYSSPSSSPPSSPPSSPQYSFSPFSSPPSSPQYSFSPFSSPPSSPQYSFSPFSSSLSSPPSSPSKTPKYRGFGKLGKFDPRGFLLEKGGRKTKRRKDKSSHRKTKHNKTKRR